MNKITTWKIVFFIGPLLKIVFSVPVEQVKTEISNPRVETLKVGLKIAVSTRSTVTSNKILKRVAMKNNMHYSKQNAMDLTIVKFATYSDNVILAMRTQRFKFL